MTTSTLISQFHFCEDDMPQHNEDGEVIFTCDADDKDTIKEIVIKLVELEVDFEYYVCDDDEVDILVWGLAED